MKKQYETKLSELEMQNEELLVIQRIKTEYGMQEGKGYAKLYEDADRMKQVELGYVLKRNAVPGTETEGEEA